jgi:hypothetical protein
MVGSFRKKLCKLLGALKMSPYALLGNGSKQDQDTNTNSKRCFYVCVGIEKQQFFCAHIIFEASDDTLSSGYVCKRMIVVVGVPPCEKRVKN